MSMKRQIQRAFDLEMPDILDRILPDCCARQKTVTIKKRKKFDSRTAEFIATAASLALLIGGIGIGILYYRWVYDDTHIVDPPHTTQSTPSEPTDPDVDPELAARLMADATATFGPDEDPNSYVTRLEQKYGTEDAATLIGYTVYLSVGDYDYAFTYDTEEKLQEIEATVATYATAEMIHPQVALRKAKLYLSRNYNYEPDEIIQVKCQLNDDGQRPYYEIILYQYERLHIYKYDCRIDATDCGMIEEFFYQNSYSAEGVQASDKAIADAGVPPTELFGRYTTEVNTVYGMEPHFDIVFYHGNSRYRYRVSRGDMKILEKDVYTAENEGLQYGRIVYDHEIRDVAMKHLELDFDDVFHLEIEKYQENGMYHYTYMNNWLIKIDFAGNVVDTQHVEREQPPEYGMGWLAVRQLAINQLNGGTQFIKFIYSTRNVDGGVYCVTVTTGNNTNGSGTFFINALTGVIRYGWSTGLNTDTAQYIALQQAGVPEETVSGLNMSDQPDGLGNVVRRVCFVSENTFYTYDLDPVTGSVLRHASVQDINGSDVVDLRVQQAVAYTGGGKEQLEKALCMEYEGVYYVLYGQESIRYCVSFDKKTGELTAVRATALSSNMSAYPIDPEQILRNVLDFANLPQDQKELIESDPEGYAAVDLTAASNGDLLYQVTLKLGSVRIVYTVDMYTGVVLSQKQI